MPPVMAPYISTRKALLSENDNSYSVFTTIRMAHITSVARKNVTTVSVCDKTAKAFSPCWSMTTE